MFKDTKDRLSKRTGIKGKQFERIKFALISRSSYARPEYLKDGKSIHVVPTLNTSNAVSRGCAVRSGDF